METKKICFIIINLLPTPEDFEDKNSEQVEISEISPIKPSIGGDEARYLASPNFAKQKIAGYDPNETFKIPEGMEFRVNFWKDIYKKYTTDQIVIHDSKWLVIYSHVDISDLNRKKSSSICSKYLPAK